MLITAQFFKCHPIVSSSKVKQDDRAAAVFCLLMLFHFEIADLCSAAGKGLADFMLCIIL